MRNNRAYGILGVVAAFAAAVADLALQYTSVASHVGSPTYEYLMDASDAGLTVGFLVGVPAVLGEISGFWFVSRGLCDGENRIRSLFLASGVTAFTLGAAFHAMFSPIGLALKQARARGASAELLAHIANAVRPLHHGLGIVVVAGILIYSLVFAWAVVTGRSSYPRMAALASPIVFVLLLALVESFAPVLRTVFVPCGLNLANAFLFGTCLLFQTRTSVE